MASDGILPHDEKSLVEYIKATPTLSNILDNQFDKLEIREVGDGNINFVYVVVGSSGSFVIKQALPYMRCLGESCPLTKERAYFEATALKEHCRLCPDHVPEVFHLDRAMGLIGMRYLEPPHIILRKGLIAGIEYPLLAEHMSGYMAKTLFFTSLLYVTTTDHKRAVSQFCGNVEMCRRFELVIFCDPFKVTVYNQWTSPYLDEDAKAVREDNALKIEVAELKSIYCERAQALIHGDLHTGSVMVTCDSTQVIDLEFAFYGPMGFDVGAFIGNLIVAYFSQDGHVDQGNDRELYKNWILKTIIETWNLFEHKFLALWDEHKNGRGEAYLPEIYNNTELQQLIKQKYMKELFEDTLGFGAIIMICGIVGPPDLKDFGSIKDAAKRADSERRALNFFKMLLKQRRNFKSIDEVANAIQHFHLQ